MLENESMINNNNNTTSQMNNTSLSFATELNNKDDDEEEENGGGLSSEADEDESPAHTSGDVDETIITSTVPFPSPKIDKDLKQRFTWTDDDKQDVACERQPISSATTSSTDSIVEEELVIVESTITTTTITNSSQEKSSNPEHDEEPASSLSSSKSPPPHLDDQHIQQQQESSNPTESLSGDDEFHSPSSEIRSLTEKYFNHGSTSSSTEPANQSNLIDSIIKLNSDIESTIRRQSISARYLMKTQQQKQQHHHQSGTPIVGLETGSQSQMRRDNDGANSPVSSSSSSVSSSSSCLNETSSSKMTIRKLEDISGVISEANLEGIIIS